MFDWYRIFNLQEFLDSGLVSFPATVVLDGIGQRELLIVRGVGVGVQLEDIFLRLDLNGRNPMRFGERAIFLDPNGDVWLGVYRVD